MIDFSFTEEQVFVQKLARDFANREVAATIQENDVKGFFDPANLGKMAELGLLGLSVPERYGGAGLIRACLEASVEYSRMRRTFERPIAEHQLVKEMIAEMAVDDEASRMLRLKAGWLKNEGRPSTKETSAAKLFACAAARRRRPTRCRFTAPAGSPTSTTSSGFFRNAKGAQVCEGTREVHKLLQADYALGLRADKPGRKTLPRPE